MLIIIGSGPSGVSCAKALLRRGVAVLMIDGGQELEDEKTENLSILHEEHSNSVKFIKQFKNFSKNKSKHSKVLYGSDFIYRGEAVNKYIFEAASCKLSLAKGGLSRVWGGVIFPFNQVEINSWGVSMHGFSTYYKKVAQYLPLAMWSENDVGEKPGVPIYHDHVEFLEISNLARHIIYRYKKNSELLKNDNVGIVIDSSRLSIMVKPVSAGLSRCNYCGLCMYGCPSGLIYDSVNTLTELKRNKNFQYMPGYILDNFKEEENEVVLFIRKINTQEVISKSAKMLFLGSGPVSTASIVLNSLEGLGKSTLIIKDSQHFVLVGLILRFYAMEEGRSHSLSQLVMRVNNSDISKNEISLQLYTYSDLLYDALTRGGLFWAMLRKIMSPILKRVVILQGYLHSNDSGYISVSNENDSYMHVRGHQNSASKLIIKKLKRLLFMNSKKLGFMIIPFVNSLTAVGGGNHIGSSLPMTKEHLPHTTDELGRLRPYKRVYVVDGSVLPNMPAGSPTYTIMSNAYRIGETCELLL